MRYFSRGETTLSAVKAYSVSSPLVRKASSPYSTQKPAVSARASRVMVFSPLSSSSTSTVPLAAVPSG